MFQLFWKKLELSCIIAFQKLTFSTQHCSRFCYDFLRHTRHKKMIITVKQYPLIIKSKTKFFKPTNPLMIKAHEVKIHVSLLVNLQFLATWATSSTNSLINKSLQTHPTIFSYGKLRFSYVFFCVLRRNAMQNIVKRNAFLRKTQRIPS